MSPGPLQIIIVIFLILIVFGANRLPTIADNLAKGIKNFKKAMKEDDTPAAAKAETPAASAKKKAAPKKAAKKKTTAKKTAKKKSGAKKSKAAK